jgi:hypothetical protein
MPSPVVVDDPETLVNDSTSSSVFIGVVARLVSGSSRERARLDTDLSDLLREPASRRPTLACFLPASCVSFNAAALFMIRYVGGSTNQSAGKYLLCITVMILKIFGGMITFQTT